MAWWDIALDIVGALADNVSGSKSKTKAGKLRKDDVEWLLDQQQQRNRVNHYSPYMSHVWDEEKQAMTTDFSDTEWGRALQDSMRDTNAYWDNRQVTHVPHQMASIADGLFANKMYRMGILDDESLPNLTQDNYGTRVGDQDRSGYGLNPDGSYTVGGGDSFTGGEDSEVRTTEFRDENRNGIDDRDEDEFGPPRGSTRDPSNPGRGGADMYPGGTPGFYEPGGGGNPAINDIINQIVSNGQLDPTNPENRGTYASFKRNVNAGKYGKWAGYGAGALTGIKGLGALGEAIGRYIGDTRLGQKVWQSDGRFGGDYDAWEGEGPNPTGTANTINDAINEMYPPNSSDNFGNYNPPVRSSGDNSNFYTRGAGEAGGGSRHEFGGGNFGKMLPGGGSIGGNWGGRGAGTGAGYTPGASFWGYGGGWGSGNSGGGGGFSPKITPPKSSH